MTERVSVICTVLNEGEGVRRLLDSLVAQTRQPDEVVFVDGGSGDNTAAIIESYGDRLPLRLIVSPNLNISAGRNLAIELASGDLIAATDAGVWLEPVWLAEMVAGFRPGIDLVAGFFVPDVESTFERAMGATVLPGVEEIDPHHFLPSSRSVAFRKSAWRAVGGYPEWLDYCEDLIFDFQQRARTPIFGWAPQAVAHFRPRSTFSGFFRQYYRYARGDGKADLWRRRHAIRYLTYLIGLPVLLWLLWRRPLAGLLALGCGVAAYCRTPYRRLAPGLAGMPPVEQARAVALVPLIRLVGDVAKMLGYPAGLVWRCRHRSDIPPSKP